MTINCDFFTRDFYPPGPVGSRLQSLNPNGLKQRRFAQDMAVSEHEIVERKLGNKAGPSDF